jgi:hypothetical protein
LNEDIAGIVGFLEGLVIVVLIILGFVVLWKLVNVIAKGKKLSIARPYVIAGLVLSVFWYFLIIYIMSGQIESRAGYYSFPELYEFVYWVATVVAIAHFLVWVEEGLKAAEKKS